MIWRTLTDSNVQASRQSALDTSWQAYNIKTYKSKKLSNDQELIQSDPTPRPQNQKGNNQTHKSTTVYEKQSRQTEWTALSQIGGHSAT